MRVFPVILLLVTAFVPAASAEPGAAHSGIGRQTDVAIPRFDERVEIDGVLDEPAWEHAARLTGFSQYAPTDGRPAQNATEVFVWYSPTAIHFGVRAHAEPGTVRASLANRDRIDADDGIDIFLSTFSDGTMVGVRDIPRLKVEYQLSRAIFLRWIGEYDANEQDTLRDDTRTELPIVVRDPATGVFERQPAFEENRFRNDWLFSYQPTPGTVLFAGYGSTVSEPRNLRFNELRRLTDSFFVKFSYLIRL